tara:strand:+ start:2336 stop:3001 length:666 start_codon:yes stop_codon:yes gene_type:complete
MNIIIQARASSKRLPNKVLIKINEKNLLEYLIDRLNYSRFKNQIYIATSTNKKDDQIEDLCREKNIKFYRGSLQNVFMRFVDLIKFFKLNSFIRICADSPMMDPRILDKAISLFKFNNFDIVTNKFPRSYPKGQTVEIIKSEIFLNSINLVETLEEKEHVTLHLYKYHKLFKIKNFLSSNDLSKKNLSIDTKTDFKNFKKYLKKNDYFLGNKTHKKILLNY